MSTMPKNYVIAALTFALAVSLGLHLMRSLSDGPEEEEVLSAAEPPADVIPVEPHSEIELKSIPEPPSEPKPEPEPPAHLAALEEIFAAAEENTGLAGAAIGFSLVGPDGEILFERAGKVALIPASALKTVTTATALEVLGPDFTFETRLGTSLPTEAETDSGDGPHADLILVGGGDPTLSLRDLESWAKALAEAGVQSIPGRVVGDGRHFEGSPFADFWNWGDIGNGYGSPVSGLNLSHNRFTAIFAPGEEDNPAQLVGTFPDVPGVEWWNETKTAAENSGDGVVIHGGERASVMHLRGTVPLGGELEVTGAVPDPERFAAHHLREALIEAGIQVTGEAVGAGQLFLKGETVPEIAEEILLHRSPPLIDIVNSIHATSDNHETECLYRTLGLRMQLAPDEAVRKHWRERGLDLHDLRMVDGSGLARADHISAESLARIQQFAASGPVGESYVESLLELGESSIRFKAGAMSSIRSYAGLVPLESGPLAFALIVNHYPDPAEVNQLQQDVFEALLLAREEGENREEAEEKFEEPSETEVDEPISPREEESASSPPTSQR